MLFSRFGGRCRPDVWVDGVKRFDPDVDLFVQPEEVEAIEVYRGTAQTPAQFGGTFDTCGAIVLWTR